jgi:hypothetical protein
VLNLRKNRSGLAAPLAVVAAAALGVVLPFSWLGIPSGHDFEFHLNSWMGVVNHWKQGVLLPHWAAWAHYGFGECRFVFYPPVSWTLGALLGLILPWKIVPAVYIWMVLTLAGTSMFYVASKWLSRQDAMIAAAVYACNPYHLVIVYWRSAFAELLAAACLPLLLLFVLRLEEDGPRGTVPLGLILGAGWLTNIPSAVMMNYSLAALVCCLAISKRSPRVLVHGAIAAVLGAALAGVYVVPVFHQQGWVNLGQVLAPGVRPLESFLFTKTTDADHDRFNRLISVVAVWQMAILGAAIFISRKMRKPPWWPLAAWGTLSALIMFHFTFSLWMYLPELKYVQFPWRWLLCLNVPFALLTVTALRRRWLRALVYAFALASVLLVWRNVQPPWWDKAADIQEMADSQQEGAGDEGVDEYVPAGVDPYDADQNAPRARFEGDGRAEIQVRKWMEESRTLKVRSTSAGKIALRLFNYPSWRVTVNHRPVETLSGSFGQMLVTVPKGESQVEVRFVEGWDRWAGVGISLTAALACFLACRRFSPSTRRSSISS